MIDGHCHLDRNAGDCHGAMRSLYEAASSAGIESILLLNLSDHGFKNDEVVRNAVERYKEFYIVFPSVNPLNKTAVDEMEQLKALGARGVKLHPRLHGYRIHSDECLNLLSHAAHLRLPLMIDCFPDGKNLSLGNTPESFAWLSDKLPHLKVAMGHAGGHRILDALMVAKYYKNIYLDLSYTLLYYRGSTLLSNIAYAIKSIKAERIFWGSDFPDRSYEETVKLSLRELHKMSLPDGYLRAVLETNAKHFIEGHD